MRRTISHVRQVRIALNEVCLWSGASRGHGRPCLCLYLLSEIVYPLSETCDGCGGEKEFVSMRRRLPGQQVHSR